MTETASNPVFQFVLTPPLGLQVSWLYTLRIRSDYRPEKPPSVKQAKETYKAAAKIFQKVEAKIK
jgi:hypothetical protein